MLCGLGYVTKFPAPCSEDIDRVRETSMLYNGLAKCKGAEEGFAEEHASGVRQLDLNPGPTTYLFFFFFSSFICKNQE